MNADRKPAPRIPRSLCFLLGFVLPGASMFMWSYLAFWGAFWESLFAGLLVGLVFGILSALFGERALNFLLEFI